MPKTEATIERLTSKCTAHIGLRKSLKWCLLCILGYLLQARSGNHVYLPQVGGQKRNPQIDGTYKVRNLHNKIEAAFHCVIIGYS